MLLYAPVQRRQHCAGLVVHQAAHPLHGGLCMLCSADLKNRISLVLELDVHPAVAGLVCRVTKTSLFFAPA